MKHEPTQIFDTKRNHKFLSETRAENDRSAFAWLLDWKAILAITLVFGILGGSQLYLGNDALGWGFIGIVIILSSAFVCFRIVLPVLKWLVGLVE
jgi:O-antigen/teichoic acid export membrane protein